MDAERDVRSASHGKLWSYVPERHVYEAAANSVGVDVSEQTR